MLLTHKEFRNRIESERRIRCGHLLPIKDLLRITVTKRTDKNELLDQKVLLEQLLAHTE